MKVHLCYLSRRMAIRGASPLPVIVKICRLVSSLGVVLSERFRAMGPSERDGFRAAQTRDADFSEAVEAGHSFMRRYPDAMKKLAE